MARSWNFQGTEGEKRTTLHNMVGGSRQGGQR